MGDNSETQAEPAAFDPAKYPADSCFHERRTGKDRRHDWNGAPDGKKAAVEKANGAPQARRRVERRRRVDPTTFEKQYSSQEIEFMNAMHEFKVQTTKAFPTYREVLGVAVGLGYHKAKG
jgi:hypothetical protein